MASIIGSSNKDANDHRQIPTGNPKPMMTDRQLLIALNASNRISRSALCHLSRNLDEWKGLAEPSKSDAASLGVPLEQVKKALRILETGQNAANREEEKTLAMGGRILTVLDDDYPASLLDHSLPPPVLYCLGEVPKKSAIAVVGSRSMSQYGQRVTREFCRALATAGLTIVSGFARGVDTEAHRAALDSPEGTTVAVLGCGLDIDYPLASTPLAEAIALRGALISEFPLGTPPRPWNFPVRNRIIAALGFATLVVEAARRSGSLITAHQALEMGRDVYAVPGSIFEDLAHGTNGLIADGAHIARSVDDILDVLPLAQQQELFPSSKETTATLSTLPARPTGWNGKVVAAFPEGRSATSEELAGLLGSPVDRILGALLELELGGWIQRHPGPVYTLYK